MKKTPKAVVPAVARGHVGKSRDVKKAHPIALAPIRKAKVALGTTGKA